MSEIREQKKRSKVKTILLRILLGLVISIVLVVGSLLIYLNVQKNEISEKLLQTVNKELKGDFSVENISLGSLFSYPILEVTINGLQFRAPDGPITHGELILDVRSVSLMADLSEVLSSVIQVQDLYINEATLYIERDSAGNSVIAEGFRPLNPKSESEVQDSTKLRINIDKLIIENSKVKIVDHPTDIMLPISLNSVKGNFKLVNDLINGNLDVNLDPLDFEFTDSIFLNDLPIRMITDYTVNIDRDLVMVKCKELFIGDEHYSLNYHYDFTEDSYMDMQMSSLDAGVDLETLFTEKVDTINDEESIKFLGQIQYRSRLYWKPDSKGSFMESVEASFDLEGKNLKIYGVDLDDALDKFKRSQRFNLADIGAVMFAGPAGLAVTKGSDFARLAFNTAGDSTSVNHFVASWELKNGNLLTRDVALSTESNLIATSGWYQTQTDSLDFKFSILDKRGCELVGQRIYGTSLEPQYGKVKLFKTLLGPVTNFFRNIGMAKCDTIYRGTVRFPEEQK